MRFLRLIVVFTLFLLISASGLGQNITTDYFFQDEIPHSLIKDFIKKGVIDKEDYVIAISKTDYNELNSFGRLYKENFTILTKDRLFEIDQFGDRVTETEILIDDILKMEFSKDSTSINIFQFDSINHDHNLNEDNIFFQFLFFRNIMEDKEKGLIFFYAIEKEWMVSDHYEYNRKIYSQFFDANGKYIPRQSDIIRSDKLSNLSNSIDSLNIPNFPVFGDLIIFNGEYFYQIDYDVYQQKYFVNKVELKLDEKQVIDMTDIVINYEIYVKNQHELPYVSRGITFLNSEILIILNKSDILKLIAP